MQSRSSSSTFVPTRAFVSVDFPAFGAPTNAVCSSCRICTVAATAGLTSLSGSLLITLSPSLSGAMASSASSQEGAPVTAVLKCCSTADRGSDCMAAAHMADSLLSPAQPGGPSGVTWAGSSHAWASHGGIGLCPEGTLCATAAAVGVPTSAGVVEPWLKTVDAVLLTPLHMFCRLW